MDLNAIYKLRLARAWLLQALLLVIGLSGPVKADQARYPLEPAITSSPRETLHTFMTANDALWTIVREEGLGKRTREGLQEALEWDIRAKRTFDLTEVAPEARAEAADDVTVFLYEVLSRIELPPIDEVPDDEAIKANPDLDRWTLPHTEITIHRVAEGPRKGEFLFTPETIERAREFYERTQELPYLRTPPIDDVSSFVEVYGGWDVPIAWVDALPAGMRKVAWGQAVWKWVLLLAAGAATLLLTWLVYRLTRRRDRPQSAWQHLRNLAVPVVLLVLAIFVQPRLTELTLLTGGVAKASDLTGSAVAYLSLAWIVWILIIAAGEAVIGTPRIRAESLDASLIRLTARTIALAVVTILIFQGASKIGIPLVGLVASVSIGGLAIALAAQDTLKSLLGSLMILIDQPYRVGERIIAGGHDGVVERIGLRSTRIRQLDGNVTSIPNESMATMNIENIGRRGSIRRKTQLRIATGTPRDKVEQAVAIAREILTDHEGMQPENPPRVYFDEFNPDSLSIRIYYWYEPPDYWAFCKFSERVNLEIIRRFAEADVQLAPPTSRTHLADEAGQPLDLPVRSKAPLES